MPTNMCFTLKEMGMGLRGIVWRLGAVKYPQFLSIRVKNMKTRIVTSPNEEAANVLLRLISSKSHFTNQIQLLRF